LIFCQDLKGYGWVFRKEDYLNIGLGREDHHRLAEHVHGICRYLKAQGRLPPQLPGRFNGHAYLLYNRAQRSELADGVLLIGDAAGLAYPQSGEGIRPAVESGLLAATIIREAQGDYRRVGLAGYRARLRQRFGEREVNAGIADYVPAWLKHSLARRLLATPWFTRHIVLDRWFLHSDQAPLLTDSP
jgi:flavin-dependent dehydrogenase